MLEDSQAPLILTQQWLLARLPDHEASVICLDTDWAAITELPADNPVNDVSLANLSYVIYTSGSTGTPKGVAITHQSVAALLSWAQATYTLEQLAGVLASTSICFDLSVFELFVPLSCGGTVILAEDALQLPSLPAAGEVTLVNTVPSAIAELLRVSGLPESVRTVNLAGEPLPPRLVHQLYQQSHIQQVINLYGPSEDTTYSTYGVMPRESCTTLTIGRPIANTQMYGLDSHGQPVPIGVPGQLFIAGVGLARGYLNRPELTAERFIPNPFVTTDDRQTAPITHHVSSERLYKTGDLVRYRPDGNLEFLGRIDHQVKVRGFRIELGEIEIALGQHPAVREVVVVVPKEGPFATRLVAYLTTNLRQSLTVEELRRFLQAKLPQYMVPSAFVWLDALPQTPNGKVDRQTLSTLEHNWLRQAQAYVAPRTPIEEQLVRIWSEVLGVERVGVDTNFFELGGHSLLATQVISRIRDLFRLDMSVRTLFEEPTVAGLAEWIETTSRGRQMWSEPPLRPVLRTGFLPLSFAQRRLWFLERMEPNSPFYNVPAAVRLRGSLGVAALRYSLEQIVQRHEVLRTTFATVDGSPVQVIAPSLPVPLTEIDLQHVPVDEREARMRELATAEARQPFALAKGPLVRATLLRLGAHEHVLLLVMHHIVSDGWSTRVLLREVRELYASTRAGRPADLPTIAIQYADFTVWQRQWLEANQHAGVPLQEQLAYWSELLRTPPPPLELPTDRPRPAVQTFRGAKHALVLPSALTDALQALSRSQGATLFMTLLAAFQTLLYRYTGQTDIAVGSPIANRNRAELENLIGFFVNMLVLRTNLANNPSFITLLERVREVALGAYAHQDLPFEKLVEELRPERDMSRTPLFQVTFVLQNAAPAAFDIAAETTFWDVTLEVLDIESGTAKFDLTLDLTQTPDGLRGWLEYNADLFDGATIARIAEHFQTLLISIVADPQQRISTLPLLTETERHQLVVEWNAPRANFSPDRLLHELIVAQVERMPEAVAVIQDERQEANDDERASCRRSLLTYSDLNRRANQLAHYLQACGVGPDTLVGICMERSLEMVVGLLGILKAGGAYVPLDPIYPKERLSFMVEDSRMPVVLIQSRLLPILDVDAANHSRAASHKPALVCLDQGWDRIAQERIDSPAVDMHPDNLAYVLYTSGSTGRPKGVMISHRAACNHMMWMQATFPLGTGDRVLQKTSFSFDASVWEFFVPLIAGAQLVMARPGSYQDSAYVIQAIQTHDITTLQVVPTLLRMLLILQRCMALGRRP